MAIRMKPGPVTSRSRSNAPSTARWAVKKQFTQLGSFLEVDDPKASLRSPAVSRWWPSSGRRLPQRGARQTILGRWDTLRNTGYALGINPAGHLEFWVGNGTEVDYVTAELPLLAKVWYLVGVSYDRDTGPRRALPGGRAQPLQFAGRQGRPLRLREPRRRSTSAFGPTTSPDVPFLVAGARDEHALRGAFVGDLYAGKIDRPAICERALTRAEFDAFRQGGMLPPDGLLAYWDTSQATARTASVMR